MPDVVLASFNAHAGVRPRPVSLPYLRHAPRRQLARTAAVGREVGAVAGGRPAGDGEQAPDGGPATGPAAADHEPATFDLVEALVGLDADIVVVQEAFRPYRGTSHLEQAADKLGYDLHQVMFGRAALHPWPHLSPDGPGEVGLAVLSRHPLLHRTDVRVRPVLFDPAPTRYVLQVTVDVAGVPLDVIGIHLTSRLPHGPPLQLRQLRPLLPTVDRLAVAAGDFNLWGPAVGALLEGWHRPVRGRTWPAHRPHSQIDHILVRPRVEVLSAAVLDDVGSDHLPVRADLRLPTG